MILIIEFAALRLAQLVKGFLGGTWQTSQDVERAFCTAYQPRIFVSPMYRDAWPNIIGVKMLQNGQTARFIGDLTAPRQDPCSTLGCELLYPVIGKIPGRK